MATAQEQRREAQQRLDRIEEKIDKRIKLALENPLSQM